MPDTIQDAPAGPEQDSPSNQQLLQTMRDLSVTTIINTDMSQRAKKYQQQQLQPHINYEAKQTEMRAEFIAEQEKLLEEKKPTFLQSITSMYELENPISQWVAKESLPRNDPQEGYNPLTLEGELEGYEEFAEYFIDANNPAVTATIKSNIDRERYNRNVIARSSGGLNLFTGILAGFSSPMTLGLLLTAPMIGASSMFASASAVKRLSYGASIGVAQAAIEEVLLHDMQYQRTMEESALNLVVSVLLDGTLGSIALAKVAGTKQLVDARNEVHAYMQQGGKVEITDPFDPKVKSVGAAQTIISGPELVKPGGIKWVMGKVALKMTELTPLGRTLQSDEPLVVAATRGLSENNWKFGNEEVGAYAAESNVKADFSHVAAAETEIHNLSLQAKKEYGMTDQDFSDAMDFGGRRRDTHENPLVDQALKIERKVNKEIVARAAEFEVYPTKQKENEFGELEVDAEGNPVLEPVEQVTAESYRVRNYDWEKIDADPLKFKEDLGVGRIDGINRENTRLDGVVENLQKRDGPTIARVEKATVKMQADVDTLSKQSDKAARAVKADSRELGKITKEGTTAAKAKVERDALKVAKQLDDETAKIGGDIKKIDAEIEVNTKAKSYTKANEILRTDIEKLKGSIGEQLRLQRAAEDRLVKAETSGEKTSLRMEAQRSEVAMRDLESEIRAKERTQKANQDAIDSEVGDTKVASLRKSRETMVEKQKKLAIRSNKEMDKAGVESGKIDAAHKAKQKELRDRVANNEKAVREFKKSIEGKRKDIAANKTEVRGYHKKQEDITARKEDPTDLDAVERFSESMYESIMNMKLGDTMKNTSNNPNIVKHRVDILDEFVEPYLQKNWRKSLQQTSMSLVPKTRVAQKFGDPEMKGTLEQIDSAFIERISKAREAGDIKGAKKLQRQRKSARRDIEVMRDRLLLRVAGRDGDDLMKSLGRSMLNFNVTRLLNSMAISSIPELGKILAAHGLGPTVTAMAKAGKSWRIKDIASLDEAGKITSASFRAQGTHNAQMAELYDITPTTALETGTKKLAQWTAYLSGQQGLDSTLKNMAGMLSADGFGRAVQTGDVAKLKKMGLTDRQIVVAQRELAKHGEVVDGLMEPRVESWDLRSHNEMAQKAGYRPDDLRDAYEAMLVREADTLIVQPGIGDKPIFMDSMSGRLIFQFKTFIVAATNRTLVPMLQGSNVDAAKMLAWQSGLAMMSYVAYSHASGREIDWDDHTGLMKEIMDRGGYTGYLMEMNNVAAKAFGFGTTSRFQSRNKLGGLLGPTYGTASELLRVADVGSDPETGKMNVDADSRIRAFRKLTPFQNHWATRRGLDNLEGEIAKSLGGTGRFGQ